MAAGWVTVSDAPVVHPGGGLRLQVDAQTVRRLERRLGRTPGVEAHVVEAVLLAPRPTRAPTRGRSWADGRFGDTPRNRACRAGRWAGRSTAFPSPRARRGGSRSVAVAAFACTQRGLQAMKHRMELVPRRGRFREAHGDFMGARPGGQGSLRRRRGQRWSRVRGQQAQLPRAPRRSVGGVGHTHHHAHGAAVGGGKHRQRLGSTTGWPPPA